MRNRWVLLGDLPLVAVAAFGAFALRFDLLFVGYHPQFVSFLAAALVLKPVTFYAFGMYRRYWRYASVHDLVAVVLAVSAASVAVAVSVALLFALGFIPSFSRGIILIDWLLMLALAGGMRMSIRVIGDARQRAHKGNGASQKRVLVAGAGEAGTLVAREMQKNPQLGMTVVGFLDDAPAKVGKRMCGVSVLGSLSAIEDAVAAEAVDQVIIAMPSAPGTVVRALAERCRQAGVPSRTVPGVFELLDGHVSVSRLRNVEIADLLRRSQIVSRPDAASYVRGRTVLVTGAGGSIGSELCRQVAFSRPEQLLLLGHGENSVFDVQMQLAEQFPEVRTIPIIADIRDAARVERVFGRLRPSVIFHAAAHKHVPLMEENPEEAVTNNVAGTFNVVNAARQCGATHLVLISSDKAVAPRNIMGATKRLAEAVVMAAGRQCGRPFVAVRFGNVLGSRGSVVPIFKRQIERGGPVTVTHPDMTRYFMTIPEAVHLVLQAGGMGRPGDLFVLNMGDPVRIVDLATDLIRLSGLDPSDIPIRFTGMRPGEKLTEDLWERDASVEPTENAEIVRVVERPAPEVPDVLLFVETLAAAARDGRVSELRALVAQAVPQYAPTVQMS
jgi:FlaA1/EpsC-like NDP-sugar epimerase